MFNYLLVVYTSAKNVIHQDVLKPIWEVQKI